MEIYFLKVCSVKTPRTQRRCVENSFGIHSRFKNFLAPAFVQIWPDVTVTGKPANQPTGQRFLSLPKLDFKRRSAVALECDGSFDLIRQRVDQLHSQGGGLAKIDSGGKTDAVVADR